MPRRKKVEGSPQATSSRKRPAKKKECFGDPNVLKPDRPECLECADFDACGEQATLAMAENAKKDAPDTQVPKNKKKLSQKVVPYRITLNVGMSDTPFPGVRFERFKPQVTTNGKLIAAVKGNPRYSVVKLEGET